MHPSTLWSVQRVAEYLDVPVKTIYQWRTHNYGPPGKRVGRYIRYREQDVIAWYDALDEKAV